MDDSDKETSSGVHQENFILLHGVVLFVALSVFIAFIILAFR